MINEFYIKSEDDLGHLKELINSIKSGGNVLVVKNAINFYSLVKWERYIKTKLKLAQDRRHYDIDENLVISNWWEIVYDPSRDHSYTYSKTTQPFHNDNSWFSDPAEINFFYMEKQANHGGESIFYPLSRLLEDLMKEEPQLLHDLKNTEVTIRKGSKYFNRTTILDNDSKIFWNYYRTIKKTNQIRKMCDCFFSFLKAKENSKSIINYRMETGDLFCFNDLSMLHGRLAFKANLKGDRSLFQSMWKIK